MSDDAESFARDKDHLLSSKLVLPNIVDFWPKCVSVVHIEKIKANLHKYRQRFFLKLNQELTMENFFSCLSSFPNHHRLNSFHRKSFIANFQKIVWYCTWLRNRNIFLGCIFLNQMN
ncbi:hypothetical protein BpHYR1_054331 [Brachionus plicatilis]|uniref:Uncharacterized protein n=1 Tax=Brachionus plicatilis TaxID=10195 RepID=A0A3M7S3T6_BRAPC|nr:hypothetical protein BpHYR1_054331 [Brachionus plicatilis]